MGLGVRPQHRLLMENTNRLNEVSIQFATTALSCAEIANTPPDIEHEVLRSLPRALGYESAADFLWSFRTANGIRSGRTILSPRKMKILIRRTIAGHGRREIAADLGISPQTVSNLRVKLGLTSKKRLLA
jgi:DNA-binding CsgD family transcriptional regulator